ncbi:MAG TPA: hypothetical protein VH598_10625, partial [Verrucomicrobiae bacterium]|nr:hypothetical protein [Verrucomicrobiae bacterium]
PLANYLSARDYFKSGQAESALQEFSAASGKSGLQDYSKNFVQDAEEAYRAAGYSEADAKAIASSSLILPHLAELKQAGRELADLAGSYRQAGDQASAQTALQMDVNLGRQLAQSPTQPLITTLVGIAVERIALGTMDPSAPYDNSGQTVQNRMDELIQQRQTIQSLVKQSEGIPEKMSDEDLAIYLDRQNTFGELDTLRWAINKYGQQ